MTTEPSCAVFFCEDVRYEKDEKTSYIGMLASDIEFGDLKPVSLPQLHVVVFVRWTLSSPPFGWQLDITTPSGKKEEPFQLPPQNMNDWTADPDTGLVSIVVDTNIMSLVVSGGTKILVELVNDQKRVVIGALRFLKKSLDITETDIDPISIVTSPKRGRRIASSSKT